MPALLSSLAVSDRVRPSTRTAASLPESFRSVLAGRPRARRAAGILRRRVRGDHRGTVAAAGLGDCFAVEAPGAPRPLESRAEAASAASVRMKVASTRGKVARSRSSPSTRVRRAFASTARSSPPTMPREPVRSSSTEPTATETGDGRAGSRFEGGGGTTAFASRPPSSAGGTRVMEPSRLSRARSCRSRNSIERGCRLAVISE